MKKGFMILLFILFALSLYGNDNFSLANKWTHPDETVGYLFYSLIDTDDHIVGTFFLTGNRLITPEKVITIIPRGQGPGELMNIKGLSHYNNGDIAFIESPEKIKIFEKKDGSYKIKKILWLKRGKLNHIVKNGSFCENKFFLAGMNFLSMDRKKNIYDISFVKVYDSEGQPLKNLIFRTFTDSKLSYQALQIFYYVVTFKDRVFFMAENKLNVHVISAKDLKVEKEVSLEIPEFYKKMPENFYTLKKRDKPSESYQKDIEYWQTAYSRINKVLIDGNYFVLQMRTCSDKLKKFALLFYNAENFELEKTIFIDDLLLGSSVLLKNIVIKKRGRWFLKEVG